jgi:hypothetical protein
VDVLRIAKGKGNTGCPNQCCAATRGAVHGWSRCRALLFDSPPTIASCRSAAPVGTTGVTQVVALTAFSPFVSWVQRQIGQTRPGARGFFHFVRGCSLPNRGNSLAGFDFEFVRSGENSIGRDQMKSFCRPECPAHGNFPEEVANCQGQNGGSFCPLLSAGASRMTAAMLAQRGRPSRLR